MAVQWLGLCAVKSLQCRGAGSIPTQGTKILFDTWAKKKKKFCFKILYDLRKVEKQEERGSEGLETQRV